MRLVLLEIFHANRVMSVAARESEPTLSEFGQSSASSDNIDLCAWARLSILLV